jgi:hypothetical protein
MRAVVPLAMTLPSYLVDVDQPSWSARVLGGAQGCWQLDSRTWDIMARHGGLRVGSV